MNDQIFKKLAVLAMTVSTVACSRSSFDNGIPKAGNVPSQLKSSMSISTPNYADGSSPAEVTINVMNADGDPVWGVKLRLESTGVDNTIVPCTTSDENGISRCRIYTTRAEWKDLRALGPIELEGGTVFQPIRPQMNSLAVVTSGESVVLPGGQRVISTSGIVEHDVQLADAGGIRRVRTGILGAIIND